MKIQIVHSRQVGEAIETTAVDLENDYSSTLAKTALAVLAGARFSASELRALLDFEKLDISASAATTVPLRRSRLIDFDALNRRAQENQQLELALGNDATGEDILALVQQRGGSAIVVRNADGVIDEIHASFSAGYEFETGGLLLDSVLATGAKTIVGDLAQTSFLSSSGQEQVLALAEWSISWKRKTVEATNTDAASYESSRGSTRSWTGKSKYMMLVGDASQQDAILSALDPATADVLTWNFFMDVAQGSPAFQGDAIIDGIDFGAGSGKIVGLDVSLKGTGPLKKLTQAAPIANPNTVTGLTAQV